MTAASGFKRLGFAIAAAVAVAVGVIAGVSLFVPADTVRNAVKAEIKAVTGLDPIIRGDASVSLFPWGTVSFADVVLGDESSGRPAFTAEQLTARLRLLPLLSGRIETADLSLFRPRVFVRLDADGRSNWSGLVDMLARALRSNANRTDRLISFSEIRIADGTIDFRDEVRGAAETLSGVELSLAWPAIANSFAATGRFVWRDEPIDAAVNIADLFAALTGDRAGLKIRLGGAPFKLAFDGHMSNRPSLKMEGTLATDTPSLRQAMIWAGQKPPPAGGFGRFALKAQTKVIGDIVALSAVNVELDGNTAEGVLTFATGGRKIVQGNLAAEEIDLTPYVPALRLLRGAGREWSRNPIAFEGLSAMDMDLSLSAQRIVIANVKLGRTAVAANLRAGHMILTIGESQAFGGVLKGYFGLTKADPGADFKSQLQFADVDLETCLDDLFGVRRLEGRGNLAFAVEASGNSVFALTHTLNGSATLMARQGAIAGYNIEQLLRSLERRPLSGGGDFRSGRTPFDKLTVNLRFIQGTAMVEDVRLEGTAVRLLLGGSASVPTRDLDLKGMASLMSTTAAGTAPTFDLPFFVQGRWDSPIMFPDSQTLIERSPLLEDFKDRKTQDAVRSAIERLTRGAVPGVPGSGPAPNPVAPGDPTGPSAARPEAKPQ
jgi:AsmA protein